MFAVAVWDDRQQVGSAGARSDGEEAALLLAARRRAVLRLRAESAARHSGFRAPAQSRSAASLSQLQARAASADDLRRACACCRRRIDWCSVRAPRRRSRATGRLSFCPASDSVPDEREVVDELLAPAATRRRAPADVGCAGRILPERRDRFLADDRAGRRTRADRGSRRSR